jgi:hypothetical protein
LELACPSPPNGIPEVRHIPGQRGTCAAQELAVGDLDAGVLAVTSATVKRRADQEYRR